MTLRASTVRNFFPLLVLILLAIFLRLYRLPVAFDFNYDQQVVAESAYQFFKFHKLSLIGQELSFQGFFLGPLHNIIEFIPYGLCNLQPACVPYFHLVVSTMTLVFLFLLTRAIFNIKTATIVSAIYAVSFYFVSADRNIDSNYFMFFCTIFLLFCLKKYFEKQNKYLPIGFFIAGIATVNFNPIFLFNLIAFFLTALFRKGKSISLYAISFVFFLINYLPLLIFNSKHQNLIINSFQNFLSEGYTKQNYLEKFIFLLRDVTVPYFSTVIFHSTNIFLEIISVVLLAWGFYIIILNKNKYLLFLAFSVAVTFFGLLLYSRHIPEYYLKPALLSVIVMASLPLTRRFSLFILVLPFFIFNNISKSINYFTIDGYSNKNAIIQHLIKDTKDETFNLYYQMPPGVNTGYSYLLKAYGKVPVEGGKNLYILLHDGSNNPNFLIFYKTFPGKQITIKKFYSVYLLSIK